VHNDEECNKEKCFFFKAIHRSPADAATIAGDSARRQGQLAGDPAEHGQGVGRDAHQLGPQDQDQGAARFQQQTSRAPHEKDQSRKCKSEFKNASSAGPASKAPEYGGRVFA